MRQALLGLFVAILGSSGCVTPETSGTGLCGNGSLNYGEECDGEFISPRVPHTCILMGYNSPGLPLCTSDCKLDPTPCVASGRCGDGFVTPVWEACDGKDNGGHTCESLGFHGGRLFCHEDCRYDTRQCMRCGDGVVQPEYGELLETGPRSCLDAGFFGGSMYTDDCVTASEDLCGEYALLSPAGSFSHPVVTLSPDGMIQFTGRATGAYPGFPDPDQWCPLLTEVFDLEEVPPRVVGYKHDPICEREFFAQRAPGAMETILYQRDEEAPVVRQLDLGEAGFVNLRQSSRGLQLERVDPAGHTLISSRLGLSGMFSVPQLVSLPGGKIGVSSASLDGLGLAVFDPLSGFVRTVGTLDRVSTDSRDFRPDPTVGHRIVWISEKEWWVFTRFVEIGGSGAFTALLRVGEAGGQFTVSQRIHGVPALTWGTDLLWLRFLGDRLELTVASNCTEVASVDRIVVSTSGEILFDKVAHLPSGSRVEALFVEEDGSVVLAGVAPSAADPDPAGQRCRFAETALARWRLDAALGPKDTRHFRTTAARWDFFSQPDFCNTGDRSYAWRDGTLVVAGTYDQLEGFCSDRERRPMQKGLPVHTCGVYLVRFE